MKNSLDRFNGSLYSADKKLMTLKMFKMREKKILKRN